MTNHSSGGKNVVKLKQPKFKRSPKRGLKRASASSQTLTDAMVKLELKTKELALAIGVSEASISHWLKLGKCPKYAALASEALLRSSASVSKDEVWMVRNVNGVMTITAVIGTERAVIGKKVYVLVPGL